MKIGLGGTECLHITARQYGEVVLPYEAPVGGVNLSDKAVLVQGTPSLKLRSTKEGMARFLASWYKLSGLYECRGTS